jgi:CheY-like chemotaxis protein
MATNANAQHYVQPETMQHPRVQFASRELAYTLIAYGLAASTQARQPQASEAPHGAEQSNELTKRHVLLVDDVDDVLVSAGAFLVKEGYAVQRAASGDEALRLIASDPLIEVLVTDFAMPGLTGGELIALAVEKRPNLKALVITGYPNADGLADLPSNTSVLAKPFRRNALIAGVKALLGSVSSEAVELRELGRLQESGR